MTLNTQIPLSQQVSADANTFLTMFAMDFLAAYQAEPVPWAIAAGPATVRKAPASSAPTDLRIMVKLLSPCGGPPPVAR